MRKERAVIYDFDNTLWNSHGKEEGHKIFLEATGNPWPHQGWWGRVETLHSPFVVEPIDQKYLVLATFEQFKKDKARNDTNIYMMTGRPPKMRRRIVELLDMFDMKFDNYFFRESKNPRLDTLEIKIEKIHNEILHGKLKVLEIHEDRPEHVKAFVTEARRNLISKVETVIVHDVLEKFSYTVSKKG